MADPFIIITFHTFGYTSVLWSRRLSYRVCSDGINLFGKLIIEWRKRDYGVNGFVLGSSVELP